MGGGVEFITIELDKKVIPGGATTSTKGKRYEASCEESRRGKGSGRRE